MPATTAAVDCLPAIFYRWTAYSICMDAVAPAGRDFVSFVRHYGFPFYRFITPAKAKWLTAEDKKMFSGDDG